MKTKILALIMAILCLTTLFAACKKTCEEHVDENKDAKCDVCEAAIECKEHKDDNKDAKCDVCGKDVEVKCDAHKDEDDDKVCDVCKQEITVCAHKDEDANKVCDLCGGAIVTVTQLEKPEAEERVDMVVNQIPVDAKLEDYIQTKLPDVSIKTADKLALGDQIDRTSNYALFRLNDEEAKKATYTILNEAFEVVYKKTVDIVENTAFAVELEEYYFYTVTDVQTKNDFDEPIARKVTRAYFAYDGTELDTLTWEASEEDVTVNADGIDLYGFFANTPQEDYVYFEGVYDSRYYGITIDDTYYVVDSDTKALLNKTAPELFVNRPNFNDETDKIGLVRVWGMEQDTLYVYDLNEWLKCTATFTLTAEDEYFILADGNILIQKTLQLHDNAVSYDYIEDGDKYDLIYTLIDTKTGEKKEIEFGYYIDTLESMEEDTFFVAGKDINSAIVYPIANDRIDYASKMNLLVNSKLEILFDYGTAFGVHSEVQLVADNRFLVKTTYDANGAYRKEILNEKGEHVAYVPFDAVVASERAYIEYDGKYYNFDMKVIFDPDKYEEENEVEVWVDTDYAEYLRVQVTSYNEETFEYEYKYYVITLDGKMTEFVAPEAGAVKGWYNFGYIVSFAEDGDTAARVEIYDYASKLLLKVENCEYNGFNEELVFIAGTDDNGLAIWVIK